jgi:hypothetical protein
VIPRSRKREGKKKSTATKCSVPLPASAREG